MQVLKAARPVSWIVTFFAGSISLVSIIQMAVILFSVKHISSATVGQINIMGISLNAGGLFVIAISIIAIAMWNFFAHYCFAASIAFVRKKRWGATGVMIFSSCAAVFFMSMTITILLSNPQVPVRGMAGVGVASYTTSSSATLISISLLLSLFFALSTYVAVLARKSPAYK